MSWNGKRKIFHYVNLFSTPNRMYGRAIIYGGNSLALFFAYTLRKKTWRNFSLLLEGSKSLIDIDDESYILKWAREHYWWLQLISINFDCMLRGKNTRVYIIGVMLNEKHKRIQQTFANPIGDMSKTLSPILNQ